MLRPRPIFLVVSVCAAFSSLGLILCTIEFVKAHMLTRLENVGLFLGLIVLSAIGCTLIAGLPIGACIGLFGALLTGKRGRDVWVWIGVGAVACFLSELASLALYLIFLTKNEAWMIANRELWLSIWQFIYVLLM